jgi:hypothetical protein
MTNDVTSSQARTFGGWQAEKVPFIFGLSGKRAALLAGAVLAAIVPVAGAYIGEAVFFWPLAIVLGIVAFARFAGRTADEWALAAASYAIGRARGETKFVSGPFAPPPSADEIAAVGSAHGGARMTNGYDGPPLDLPGILAPLRVWSVPAAHGRDLAVVHHAYDRTLTAVARLRCPGIGLADSARRDQRVNGWGGLLAGLCTEGSPVTRVQALQRLIPEDGAALRGWQASHAVPGAPALADEVTGELLSTSALVTTRRESYLSVTIDQAKARGQIRAAGGGEMGAAAVLVRQLRSLASAVSAADLEIAGWLGTRELGEVIRTAFDPHSQVTLAAQRASAVQAEGRDIAWDGLEPGVGPGDAGPVFTEARPGSYLHDGAVSVTYCVGEWPAEAYATVLSPLLGDGKSRRAFGIVFEPLSPRRAEHAVMRERTARHVAVRMRQRTGQIVPEDERVASARALSQDAERAAGHGLVRFTGYVTVTVTEPGQLGEACAAVEADAAQARIELRRMWFAQDSGFAAGALPLGIGLPRRRFP